MKNPAHAEKMRRYWASLRPDQRRKQTAGIVGDRAVKRTGPNQSTIDLEALRDAVDLAVSILQSTDDPRLRCALASTVLLQARGSARAKVRAKPLTLVRVRLESGATVYADAREMWRCGLRGAPVTARDDSGAPVSDSADSVPAWFLVEDVEIVENLI